MARGMRGNQFALVMSLCIMAITTCAVSATAQGNSGDINHSGAVDVTDAVLGLQVLTGLNPAGVYSDADINADGRIGLEESIFALHVAAGIRTGVPLPDVTLGKIADMVPGSTPAYVYAVDEDRQALYFINTAMQAISVKVDLPYAGPVAMDYSATDNKLYVVANSSGNIMVYDIGTSSLTEMAFSATATGRDIEVAPISRRIYVLSPDGYNSVLHILDMDTGETLLETNVGGSSLVLDEGGQLIYTANSGISPSSIYKYSVSSDTVQSIQTITSGSNAGKIAMSADGTRIVLPCGGGSGDGYTIYDYDASDLENVFGEWEVGTYPRYAAFSPDGNHFYGTNGRATDNYLFVMSADSYQPIRKLSFPNADRYAVFTPNSDGSTVVGFSYDAYGNDEHQLFFFSDVAGSPSPVYPGEISEMAAGGDPDFVYALDRDNRAMHVLNTSTHQIQETVAMTHAQPVAISHCSSDNDLYIVSAFSGDVTVYDIDTAAISQIPFSYLLDGRDIEVDAVARRIYVLSPDGYDSILHILNMDTGEKLLETNINGSSLVLDGENQLLYTANANLSPSRIYKYSVSSDSLQPVREIITGSNGRKLAISPDKQRIVLPCGGGSGSGYTIYDYDASELVNVFGEWDVGTYPKFAAFSPDGNYFYGSNGDPYDNYLYVMSASDYRQIRKLSFPNADDYTVLTPNSDGSVVVGFSYNTYDDNQYQFYYFTNVTGAPTPVYPGVVSDMLAGADSNIVYALDRDNLAMHILNVSTHQIQETVDLPDTQPVAFSHCASDNDLYIVSAFSGNITVYDIDTSAISQIPFSIWFDGRDIEVDAVSRRIYVLSPKGYDSVLHILNMDTGEKLLETEIGGSSMVLDEGNRLLFTANSGLSPSRIYKYSVSSDALSPVQEITTGGNGRRIAISSDKLHIVLPCGAGNGAGYTIYDFSAADLNTHFGEWDVGTYPKFGAFSPDGLYFYGSNGSTYDNNLYVMNASDYSQIRALSFPNADDYAIVTPNTDGSAVVGFSYNTTNDTSHSFSYFTNVR